ncbi:GNAT family N-acetyltransferase [Anaerotignum sp.]|uniref:GNAT family N-acetyltransferase n=1 Tax=Anaerotignum sp. TaxID=2039241 RepID=UPI0027148518|nr:GNAT family N-acetyltransferase [Anaerotignum sp.]
MIRKALGRDLNEVAAIYDEVLDYEAASVSYTNWQKGLYPTRADGEKALAEDTLFVGEDKDGRLFGCVILNHIQPKEYENISWEIPGEVHEVLVIHTLCIRPDCYGKGFGREFVAFTEKYAQHLKCKTIRLDTYEGNSPAIGLYSKLGFRLSGKCLFHFQNVIWENLVCMEKRVID